MKTIQEQWNEQADEYNQYDSLDTDEVAAFCNVILKKNAKDTVVISAFPGTGKTHFYRESGKLVIDSDSSAFSWLQKGKRHPDFPLNYLDHITKFIGVVDYILVSSHKEVRDTLAKAVIPFTLIYPEDTAENKGDYIARYTERGSDAELIELINNNWRGFLGELTKQKHCTHIVLPRGRYISDCKEVVGAIR